MGLRQPVQQRRVAHGCPASDPTRHENDLWCRDLGERDIGHHAEQAVVGPQLTRLAGTERHLEIRHPLQYLVGAYRVECSEPVEQYDRDLHPSSLIMWNPLR